MTEPVEDQFVIVDERSKTLPNGSGTFATRVEGVLWMKDHNFYKIAGVELIPVEAAKARGYNF